VATSDALRWSPTQRFAVAFEMAAELVSGDQRFASWLDREPGLGIVGMPRTTPTACHAHEQRDPPHVVAPSWSLHGHDLITSVRDATRQPTCTPDDQDSSLREVKTALEQHAIASTTLSGEFTPP